MNPQSNEDYTGGEIQKNVLHLRKFKQNGGGGGGGDGDGDGDDDDDDDDDNAPGSPIYVNILPAYTDSHALRHVFFFLVEFTPRLYNGTSVYEGRLELLEGNQWRRVCKSTIGTDEAEVICRYLGHQSLETLYNWPKFGNGLSPVFSWSFSCDPLATSLQKCYPSYVTRRKLDCESVAVRCRKRESDWNKLEESHLFVLLGVAFLLLGLATVSGLIMFMIKRKLMCRAEPIGTHGQGIPSDYTRVSTISPVRNNLELHLNPPSDEPPPSFETLS
ncbi:Neurotrypsin [Holothuria leucospilota]|uniref:Neurotrypsin n=1 Tax=Holothuria leucospilota TaxID=206669 RepID=A0A9Q1BPA8_HOLLE|nr:Neurotrypsin [Holothuria leucospilota]